MSGPSKGNIMVAGLNAENRQLRQLIEKMQQEQAQGQFIEDLQCAALTGLCSQPWILSADVGQITGREEHIGKSGMQIAIDFSNQLTNGVIDQIMKAVREAQQSEGVSNMKEQPADISKAGVIESPDDLPAADRVHPKPELIL